MQAQRREPLALGAFLAREIPLFVALSSETVIPTGVIAPAVTRRRNLLWYFLAPLNERFFGTLYREVSSGRYFSAHSIATRAAH